ncbi:MAG: MoaD/ThiS family protein [Chloroflexi bacterium]|nr:MoaD/ThiS family protein [Chloroflexota bacterium]
MARVFIPFALRKMTGGATDVQVSGATLREVIDNLEEMFPGTRERLVQDDRIKPGMEAVVGEQPTREGLRAKVSEDVEVHFIPHIAGG